MKQQKRLQVAANAALAVTLLSAAASAFAQERMKPSTEKWRPTNGLYGSRGRDFDSDCRKGYGVFTIELAKKSVSGFEWGCEINKLTDTAPGAIKLNMTCYDLNIPDSEGGPNSQERSFKEVMLLGRTIGNSMSVRKTINGKFKGPNWQADFCPEDVQRAYIEEKQQYEESKKYKVTEQLLSPNQWRPKDGIYASAGPDFNDRCAKSGDVAVGLAEGSIASGKTECKVVRLMNTGRTEVSMDMTRTSNSAKQASSQRKKDSEASSPPPSTEIIRISRIDDNTFHMEKTVDKEFKGDGGPVAFCPEEAQRAYTAKKVKN